MDNTPSSDFPYLADPLKGSKRYTEPALEMALRAALDRRAGPEEWALISADAALRAGLDSATIEGMTSYLETDALQGRLDDLAPPAGQANDGFLDPDNLPEGVGLLKDLAHKHGVAPGTVRHWIRLGRMREVGRVGGKGSGTGGFVAVRECDVIFCKDNPRKGGRPRKAA